MSESVSVGTYKGMLGDDNGQGTRGSRGRLGSLYLGPTRGKLGNSSGGCPCDLLIEMRGSRELTR